MVFKGMWAFIQCKFKPNHTNQTTKLPNKPNYQTWMCCCMLPSWLNNMHTSVLRCQPRQPHRPHQPHQPHQTHIFGCYTKRQFAVEFSVLRRLEFNVLRRVGQVLQLNGKDQATAKTSPIFVFGLLRANLKVGHPRWYLKACRHFYNAISNRFRH